ncbi:ankyrin repeat-containing domain protein [Hypoxylon crocopeplum]|nr:ankyrin repeat-containing domain protein [Hypoxylon crocopeplum]
MPGFASLPTEVKLMIVESTGQSRERILNSADLAALAAVNSHIHNLYNKVLYKSFGTYDAALFAAEHGCIDTLNVVDGFGMDVHYKSELPLRVACGFGQNDVINWLLDNGAKVNVPTLFKEQGDEGQGDHNLCSPLHAAISRGHEDTALLLLARGAFAYFPEGSSPIASIDDATPVARNYNSALHIAAEEGMLRVAKHLVKEVGLPIDLQNMDGDTPLCCSMRSEEGMEILGWLIDIGADVNREGSGHELPLTLALKYGEYDCANFLLDAGAAVEPIQLHPGVLHPIDACIMNDESGLEERRDQYSILSRLVDGGANINGSFPGGPTPLGQAIIRRDTDLMHQLIAMGARPDTTDGYRRNALDHLIAGELYDAEKYMEMLEALVTSGGRMDRPLANGQTLLEWTIDPGPSVIDSEIRPVECLGTLLQMANEETVSSEYLGEFLSDLTEPEFSEECEALLRFGVTSDKWDNAFSAASRMIQSGRFWRTHMEHNSEEEFWLTLNTTPMPIEEITELLGESLTKGRKMMTKILVQYGLREISRQMPEHSELVEEWLNRTIVQRLERELKEETEDSKDTEGSEEDIEDSS